MTPGYVGCYWRNGGVADDYRRDSNMTIDLCLQQCWSQERELAFVFSFYCFCCDSIPRGFDLLADVNCNSKCPGNQSTTCGGVYGNYVSYSVYKGKEN